MHCENCGTLTSPSWSRCPVCGEALPGPAAARLASWFTTRLHSLHLPGLPQALPRLRAPRALTIVSGGLLALALVAGSVIAMDALGAEHRELRQAQTAAAEGLARQADLQSRLSQLEATLGSRDTAANTARTEAATQITAAQHEIASLSQRLQQAESSLTQQQQTATELRRQVQLFRECLDGTAVALEFGRRGTWAAADRAIAAVAASCANARAATTP